MTDRFAPPPSTLRDSVSATVASWLEQQVVDNPAVDSVELDDSGGVVRWVARLLGEEKQVSAVWFVIRQRSLLVEPYLMPAPEENVAACLDYLMRRNAKLRGLAFVIGLEDAVYLQAAVPLDWVDADELEWLLGSFYEAVEQSFRPAMRLGFASRFRDERLESPK
ncbi:MAG: YbjN domain-containing protein [Actinomycetes bacterium]